ncbi:GNAT family N-acetyltransferase [Galactobacter sp.]|uniref:GNAT family N-acetyltransferase n=1 Tax=Galactobacter sp. TaxID=2676125 RepID=UPI0025BE32E1|nr:GNAT family N-acetyltransferase [Galactobacter sp.]
MPDGAPVHPLASDLPLFGLVLRTPRLALRPAWDEDIVGFADASVAGIHPDDEMPFASPWSRGSREEILAGTAASIWSEGAERKPESWVVSFAVRRVDADVEDWREAPIIGRQDVRGREFQLLRSLDSGSWLTSSHQGQGLGSEMRQAVVLWALDHLGATELTSGAYDWNAKSLGTSRSVGYVDNGTKRVVIDGKAQVEQHVRLTPETHRRPPWSLQVTGDMDGIRAELGITPKA